MQCKALLFTKTLLVMKLTGFLLLSAVLQVNARTNAQTVTYRIRSAPLPVVFAAVKQQTGYFFFYDDMDLRDAIPVTVNIQRRPLRQALEVILIGQPVTFDIQGNTVVIIRKAEERTSPPDRDLAAPLIDISGVVVDSVGAPLAGASITIKGGVKGTSTDLHGSFLLKGVKPDATLVITFTGYGSKEVRVEGRSGFQIILNRLNSRLDEIQVVAYGTTTKRLNTGSVGTVTSEDIEKQPVTNVLSALSGRVPGLFVQTTNGLPGGSVSISIRGKGSILAGTDPLFVIDGVPFNATMLNPNGNIAMSTINGAVSPFNSLNPADIESITVLKDADATAIYGSRGTNGVVLITTKKGTAGDTKFDANFSQGISHVTSYPRLQTLRQYLAARRAAFVNDGETPSSDINSPGYSPELTIWDTTKSTDWTKYLLGGTGHVSNGQLSISGGNSNTSFDVSGNYHAETSVLPGRSLYQRGGLFFNMQNTSLNGRFSIQASGSYTADKNRLANPAYNVYDIFLPPDYPLYDAAGNLNWAAGGNPLAETKATSKISTDNVVGNVSLRYRVLPGLNVKVTAGYNKINIGQTQIFPSAALYPGTENYTNFGNNSNQSFIIEPQLDYTRRFKKVRLSLLAGATYQDRITLAEQIVASNFTNERLMENLGSAGSLSPSNTYTHYKYESVFGRATLDWDQKYILNGTLRRDGSSRFGPGNQFGNFGSLGGAWLFSNENWMKENASFLSFSKLRASYGLTGNDQIADYQYMSTYSNNSTYNYQDTSALAPARITNAEFHWETTRKLELGLELGFVHDRILVTADWYRNRSKDQLVNYSVPTITGFSSYQANLPAVVQNSGWEFELNTINIKTASFTWTTTFNITLPKNKLLSFRNFGSSSYAQYLEIGYDITRVYGYGFTGVDPVTGLATYAPQKGSSSTSPDFFHRIGKQTPDYYGGIGNTFTYKGWQLDIFGQFCKQMARGGIMYPPGVINNNFAFVNAYWQRPGDKTNVPKPSNDNIDFNYVSSSANFFDASYFRIKNIAIAYHVPLQWLKRIGIGQLTLYAQGQNVLSFWARNGAFMDPESGTGNYSNIPPMKTFIAGLKISF
jgi:TonB-linked SusC/RagA family outer membrane protein